MIHKLSFFLLMLLSGCTVSQVQVVGERNQDIIDHAQEITTEADVNANS